jgi:3-phosphoshikimate 1-carboxyvinyltransferase
VLALFCDGTSRLRRLGNLRLKESDRLEALASGLTRLGATVYGEGDAMTVRPAGGGSEGGDHRRDGRSPDRDGLRRRGAADPRVAVSDARVVEKSYPGILGGFRAARGSLELEAQPDLIVERTTSSVL